ncbi:MAG: putative multidrug resistance ABC transporter ATP-binding/permease protein YheI [Gemmatimonadaceae bacterium]|nr:putative multidrug resistance ABC transporter ATP-binding/permease protein YheI [Gemmatimonadaceae bacterium]
MRRNAEASGWEGVKSLRNLLPYFRPYRGSLALGVGLVIAGGALASVNPWLVRAAIDEIRAGNELGDVVKLAAVMVGISLVAGVCRYWMRELLNGLSRRIETDLRNDLYAVLLKQDAAYYGRMRTGELMARLTNDLSAVRMAAGPAIMYLSNTVAGGVFALGFMLRIDRGLTLLALLPMTVLPVVMHRLGRAIHDRFEAVQEHFGSLTTRVQENLSGTRIVRAYRQEAAESERFEALSREYVRRNLELARLYGIMHPAFGLLAGAGAVIVLGAGGILVLNGRISIGSFVAFGLYLSMLTWPMISLGWVLNLFQRGAASMTRLQDVLASRPHVRDRAVARSPALPPANGGRRVEFRAVSFSYPSRDGEPPREVLRDISFRVEAGQTLAIVGATGSGKSTLVELLPRTHDPQSGQILIDDVPIASMSLEELRRELGVVPQESLLFGDTIRANLLYGAGESADTGWAARVAQLEETIAGFSGGYDTILGERGINLSGGQKQRACLARALARRPSIVLLDDALSAVDTHTEAAILHGLRAALAHRTALIASHRVSAVRDADLIIVLDDGRVVETGTHDELIQRGGRYCELLSRQELEEEIESG